MKRYTLPAIILISTIFLSGCSVTPTSDQDITEQKTPVSQSIWKSSDGGKTWEVKNMASGKLVTSDWDILRIVIDPNNSQNIYVGLKTGGMMTSSDGGETWKSTIFVSEKVYGLELNPDGNTIYASAVYNNRGKIWKSEDKGGNWKEIYTNAADGPLVVSMKLDKNNPETLWAATSDNLLLKTRDGGGSWRNVYKADNPIIQIEIDKSDPNLIYVLEDSGQILRTRDGGETFQEINLDATSFSGIGSSKISSIRLDPGVNSGIYAVGQSGIKRSNNAGDSWTSISPLNNTENAPVISLAINPKDSKKIVYGASQAAYQSVDGGENWSTFQFDVNKHISVLEYDPQNPDVIWAGFRK
ncbi:MAG TPA: YCF48-related protein [Patescibacteria group bacterium]|nr:YCF48-related protein [Patescibacteria group bacterium]